VSAPGVRRVHVGPLYTRTDEAGAQRHDHYILLPHGLKARLTVATPGAAPTLRYVHDDILGSAVLLTGESGAPAARASYTHLGELRHPDWQDPGAPEPADPDLGFTGHIGDADLGLGLVHMGGREYDPRAGRFLTADPFLPGLTNLQAFNRYGYVLNNPVSYVDPTGYASETDWL
jgi:RHS repeat-associated protein